MPTDPAPQELPAALVAAARETLGDRDGIGAVVLDAVTATVPELTDNPQVAEMVGRTVADTLTAALSAVASGLPIDAARAPDSAVGLARRLAQRGVALTAMLRAYRVGQAAFQRELITRIADRATGVAEVADAARALSSAAFSFVDHVTSDVVEVYQAELDTWAQRRNATRRATVEQVLAAGTHADAQNRLGHPIDIVHLGAVLWCGPGTENALERQVTDIADALGCTGAPLVVAPDASTLWVWFPRPARPGAALATVLGADTRLALGDPAPGLDGFRSTHRQARTAHAVVGAADPARAWRVTTPAALGPLVLLDLTPATVGPWLRATLGGLTQDDEAIAELRRTVRAYLASGRSRVAAATAVSVHRNTVEYRLRRAEKVRGRSLDDDRLSLEVALLAFDLFDPARATNGTPVA